MTPYQVHARRLALGLPLQCLRCGATTTTWNEEEGPICPTCWPIVKAAVQGYYNQRF